MYDRGKTNGEKTWKSENVTATEHLPLMKNRLSARVSAAFSIQTHCRNPRQILHRLMYDTVKTNGEKTSKNENVTPTEQSKKLTLHEKPPYDSRLRSHFNPNTLAQSASNAKSIDV